MAPRKTPPKPTPPKLSQAEQREATRNVRAQGRNPVAPKPPTPPRDTATTRRLMESGQYEALARTRPGLLRDEDSREYDDYFRNDAVGQDAAALAQLVSGVNPMLGFRVAEIAWTYRFDETGDRINRALATSGIADILDGLSRTRGGGGARYGGGGGMSKAEQYAQAEASIRNEVRTLGVGFDDASIKSLAKTAVDGRWSADMVTDYIVAGAGDWSTVQDGQLKASVELVKQLGTRYLTPISDETAREYATRLASGEMTTETIQMLVANQAKTTFSWLAPQIDQGMTVRDVLLPSRDIIARELEVAPETIDLMDQKFQQMLRVTSDQGTRAATFDEVLKNVRSTAEWRKTGRARETASNAVMMLRQAFGST
jgi:hypothetical protein